MKSFPVRRANLEISGRGFSMPGDCRGSNPFLYPALQGLLTLSPSSCIIHDADYADRFAHFALLFHGEPPNRSQMVDGIFSDKMTKTALSQVKSALNDLFTVDDFGVEN